jgi:nucleotide-binding universal stress UspA family protein
MPILCGTDLSTASGGALEVARAMAAQRGEPEVIFAHVMSVAGAGAAGPSRDAAIERMRAELDGIVAKTQADPRAAEVAVRVELRVGAADSELAAYAESEGCDLIVIAARSNPDGASLLRLGTTAERIVQASHLPVVIVRDPAPWLAFARGERPLRLLLGIDDSATCDLGIQWVHALRKLGAVEIILGAIYYSDVAAHQFGLAAKSIVDRDPEIEALIQRDLLRRFGEGPVTVTGTVVARSKRGLGRIGDHLLELAREENVDVIVIGTSQKTGLGRLGEVSSVVVHDATQAVVCIPPAAAIATATIPMLRAALVATDLSAFANRAVPYAFALTPLGGDVHVVHVVSERDAETSDEAELQRALAALTPHGAKQTVHVHITHGDDPATVIAQTAARLGVDVICIASHGRSGITRALVGSVADKLLRASRLPVLVLRPAD